MRSFVIKETDKAILPALIDKINNLTKPKGSLGLLEKVAAQIGLIQQTLSPELRKPQNIIFAADHGIVTEGVSFSAPEVTAQMISNFIIGTESTLNRMTAAGASLLLRGEVQETEEVIAKIEAVTAADVLATARAVLDTEKISYSAVGNLKGNDFGALVEKFFK